MLPLLEWHSLPWFSFISWSLSLYKRGESKPVKPRDLWASGVPLKLAHLFEVFKQFFGRQSKQRQSETFNEKPVEREGGWRVWLGISPVSGTVDSRGQGQGAPMTGRLVRWSETDGCPDAGLLRPWRGWKVKPAKMSKKGTKKVTIGNTGGLSTAFNLRLLVCFFSSWCHHLIVSSLSNSVSEKILFLFHVVHCQYYHILIISLDDC